MTTLTVPPPLLALDPPTGPAALEKPIGVLLAGLQYPDLAEVAPADVRSLGVLVYRGTAGSEEVWDEAGRSWEAAPVDPAGLLALTPLPLSPPTTPGASWTGTLIAAGQTDGAGNPRYEKAGAGAPVYRLRAVAAAVRDGVGHSGVSDASADILFVSATDEQRLAVDFDTGRASDAGRVRILLRNVALQPAGYLEIRAAGGQEIELVNCTPTGTPLARVTVTAAGDIHLVPSAGRDIVLDGPLEAGRITYQPQGGGARQTL